MDRPLLDPWFDAAFIGRINPETLSYYGGDFSWKHNPVLTFDEAQGLLLWCPCGAYKTDYPLGGGRPHAILIPFHDRGVPDRFGPQSQHDPEKRPRWRASGTGLHDLTLTPSIDTGCWHAHICDGKVLGCPDPP